MNGNIIVIGEGIGCPLPRQIMRNQKIGRIEIGIGHVLCFGDIKY